MPDNIDQLEKSNISEGGPSEGSLSPNGGTAAGDIKINTIATIVASLGTKSQEDLNGFAASIAQIGHEADPIGGGSAASNKASIAAKKVVKEDLATIFAGEGENNLSEAFIDNVTLLFESALTVRLAVEKEQLQEEFETQLQEATEAQLSQFSERLDTYLDYCAEQFMEQNALAIEHGVRTELTESFIEGIKDVFFNHNVVIPEGAEDAVEALTEEVANLRQELNDSITARLTLESEMVSATKAAILSDIAEGLTDVDADKLSLLSEEVEFVSEEHFAEKVQLLRNTMFSKAGTAPGSNGLVIEEVGIVTEDTNTAQPAPSDPRMARYASTISRHITR